MVPPSLARIPSAKIREDDGEKERRPKTEFPVRFGSVGSDTVNFHSVMSSLLLGWVELGPYLFRDR